MIHCKDVAGKVVRSITLFEDGSDGPEVSIDFEDGSNFNACLGVKMTLGSEIDARPGRPAAVAPGLHHPRHPQLSARTSVITPGRGAS